MPRRDKQPPQEPPRNPQNEELGRSGEERNRHLRFAHEQYTASGQGKFGARKGRDLPQQRPDRNAERYPPGTKMPWPPDDTIEDDDKLPPRPYGS